jgi:hypothetical protein
MNMSMSKAYDADAYATVFMALEPFSDYYLLVLNY